MKKRLLLGLTLVTAVLLVTDVPAQPGDSSAIRSPGSAARRKRIPKPHGLYVVNEASNGQSTATAYAWEPGAPPPDYQSDITGHAIFYPGKNDNRGNPVNFDFPNLTGTDPVGYVASQIVEEVTALAPGRVQLQSDNIDTDSVLPEVTQFAATYATRIGWQTNKSAGKGAACFDPASGTETTCVDLGQTGVPYYDILQEGSVTGGKYVEVWSADVVTYPQSFTAAIANHLY